MAGIRPLSLATIQVPPALPPRPEAPRPRAASPVSGDSLELSADGKEVSRAILLKVALEGKDFQTARREVLAERRGDAPPPAPPSPAPADARIASVEVQAVRLDFEHLEVDFQAEGQSVHLELTRVQVQVQAARVRRAQGGAPAGPGQDPLLLDLDGNGASTSGAQGARAFDLAGDGNAQATSFVSGGDAFLALDRDGDGAITSGLELFGDQHGAVDGYEELRTFDANQDGVIDVGDPVFDHLRLLYGDGSIQSLQDAGLASLSLSASQGPATTASGDTVLRQASASRTDGSRLDTYALGLQRFDAVG